MKLLQKCLLLGSLAVILPSCKDESPWAGGDVATGKGGLNVTLTSSIDVETTMPKVRSGETYSLVAPPVSKFNIRLAKVDGSYAKTWSSIEEFAKETEFAIGVYQLEAFYGSSDSQGVVKSSEAGYEHAYYYGSVEELTVREGEVTNVDLVAELGNAAVLVEYTDEYKKYFSAWNTTLKTSGKENVELGQAEGICYVTPGTIDIVMDAVLQNGKSVFLNPAAFEAAARHLYKITYNVHQGEVQDVFLQIIFNDDPGEYNTHVLEVSLEDLENATPPELTTIGFEDGEELSSQSGVSRPEDKEIKFNILAQGGIREAKLTVKPASVLIPFGVTSGTIDLCNTDALQQAALANAGINARGFYENPDKLGYLDLTEFCRNLSAGEYEISFQVTDNYSQCSEIKSVKINNVSVNASIISSVAKFGDGYADITVSYDGPDPTKENPLSFKMRAPNNSNSPLPVDIISISKAEQTRAYEFASYVYRVKVLEEKSDNYKVDLFFNGDSKLVEDHEIIMEYPTYNVEYDAFAKRILLRVTNFSEGFNTENCFNNLQIYVNGTPWNNVERNLQTNIISIEGVNSNTGYNVITSHAVNYNEKNGFSQSISTEEEAQIPNCDFSETVETININSINVGGKYRCAGAIDYQLTSSIKRSEAGEYWASLNEWTCYNATSEANNTWFRVPSSYVENGVYIIRSVGYSHTGETLARTSVAFEYYCTSTPSKLDKISGELFLGSYSYNGSEPDRKDGISFTSRPTKLKFDYKYTPINNSERAGVVIKVKGEDNNIISEMEYNDLSSRSYLQNIDFDLSDYTFGIKAKSIQLSFKSTANTSTPQIYIPTGSELKEGLWAPSSKKLDTNSYHAVAIGSVLEIDNVQLIYE